MRSFKSYLKPLIVITVIHYALGWLTAMIALMEWDQPGIGNVAFRVLMFPYWSFQDFPEFWPVCSIANSILWAIVIIGCHYAIKQLRENTHTESPHRIAPIVTLIALLLLPFAFALSAMGISYAVASKPFNRDNARLVSKEELKLIVEQAKHYDVYYKASNDDYHFFHKYQLMGGESYRIKRDDLYVRYERRLDAEPDDLLGGTSVNPHWFDRKPDKP